MIRAVAYNIIGSDTYTGIAGEKWKTELRGMLLSVHPDWFYGGLYEDVPGSTTRLIELLCQVQEGRVDLIIIPSITVFADYYTHHKFCTIIENHGVAAYFQGEDIMLDAEHGWTVPKSKPIIYGLQNAVEGAVVQRIFRMYASGNGLIRILNALKDDCIPSPKITRGQSGRTIPDWTNTDVRHVLQNPTYVKIGMIDEATWNTTCTEIVNRAKKHFRQPKSGNPFSPLLVCGTCGNHFTLIVRGVSTFWRCKTYIRKGKEACPSHCIRNDVLERIVNTTVPFGNLSQVKRVIVYSNGELAIETDSEVFRKTWRWDLKKATPPKIRPTTSRCPHRR